MFRRGEAGGGVFPMEPNVPSTRLARRGETVGWTLKDERASWFVHGLLIVCSWIAHGEIIDSH